VGDGPITRIFADVEHDRRHGKTEVHVYEQSLIRHNLDVYLEMVGVSVSAISSQRQHIFPGSVRQRRVFCVAEFDPNRALPRLPLRFRYDRLYRRRF
jgi:hypothetical protein